MVNVGQYVDRGLGTAKAELKQELHMYYEVKKKDLNQQT
jgi:hypothetical protein